MPWCMGIRPSPSWLPAWTTTILQAHLQSVASAMKRRCGLHVNPVALLQLTALVAGNWVAPAAARLGSYVSARSWHRPAANDLRPIAYVARPTLGPTVPRRSGMVHLLFQSAIERVQITACHSSTIGTWRYARGCGSSCQLGTAALLMLLGEARHSCDRPTYPYLLRTGGDAAIRRNLWVRRTFCPASDPPCEATVHADVLNNAYECHTL